MVKERRVEKGKVPNQGIDKLVKLTSILANRVENKSTERQRKARGTHVKTEEKITLKHSLSIGKAFYFTPIT